VSHQHGEQQQVGRIRSEAPAPKVASMQGEQHVEREPQHLASLVAVFYVCNAFHAWRWRPEPIRHDGGSGLLIALSVRHWVAVEPSGTQQGTHLESN
jgi:hypothetical protein